MSPSTGLDRWLLPEGIEEALPREAERLERLRRDLLDLFHRWGYDLVMPPLIEYLESLLTCSLTFPYLLTSPRCCSRSHT
jgi:hypothetical protein